MEQIRRACCDECFHYIAKESTARAKFWLDLCDMSLVFGNMKVVEHSIPDSVHILRWLEQERFIDTMDGENGVTIRVRGYEFDEDSDKHTFCINREDHDGSW